MTNRPLVSLGEGIYTVPEVCRILQPRMTSRKVHYWLDTKLLSEPIAWGSRGQPTLLSFQQLLEIRTVQRLRDELAFSLPKVRDVFGWVLIQLFMPHWRHLRFERYGNDLVAVVGNELMVIPGGQQVMDLYDLNAEIAYTRSAWETKVYAVPGREHVVSNTRVLAGAPTVKGTRVETSILASFATDGEIDPPTLADVKRLYPSLPAEAVEDALGFEGVQLVA
jgi:uncharacterized protein (DUF433 family)